MFFVETRVGRCSKLMVEGRDTGWLTVLEKKGLQQETEILEVRGFCLF